MILSLLVFDHITTCQRHRWRPGSQYDNVDYRVQAVYRYVGQQAPSSANRRR